jgi:calcium channel MID1
MAGHITHHGQSTLRILVLVFAFLQIAVASNRPIRDEQQRSAIHDIFSPTSPALLDPPIHSPPQLRTNIKRQTGNEPLRNLTNGNAHNMNIEFGMAQYWAFSRRELESEPEYLKALKDSKDETGKRSDLRKRQDENNSRQKKVYISFNTCTQPQPVNDTLGLTVAQLELYVSTNRRNTRPGPKVVNMDQQVILIDEGLGTLELSVTDEFYLGVYAPNITDTDQSKAWKGDYNYELAVSTEGFVHNKIDKFNLFLIDTDHSSALLISGNLTEEADVEVVETPYEMFAYNQAFRAVSRGIESSYCAVRKYSQGAGAAVEMSITKRGQGNFPKQQSI